MNFLAHGLLAEGNSPEYRFGSMAPDFVGMAGGRCIRIADQNERYKMAYESQEIQAGIDFHYRVDSYYDDLDELRQLKAVFRKEIVPKYLTKDGLASRIVSSIGTDLLLDGYLIQQDPSLPADFYEALASVDDSEILELSTEPEITLEIVRKFETNLPDYSSVSQVGRIAIARASRKPKLKVPKDEELSIYRAIESYQPEVYKRAPGIISAMREGVLSAV